MKVSKSFKLIGVSMLIAVGLSACDNPGPAESAGKKIDQATENAGNKMGEAAVILGEKMDKQGVKAAAVIDDAQITAKVKAAIFAEPGLRTLQISVDTIKGVVTLSGSVDTQLNSDRAHALAGAVAGVNAVENQLMLKITN